MTCTDLTRLRKAHFALEALPDTIMVPAHPPRRPEPLLRPTNEATVDEIAFALGAAEESFNAVADRLHALRKLYRLAREAGAEGADPAVSVIEEAR